MQEPTNQPSSGFTCDRPINTGPHTYVLRAAFAALNDWVADGTRPPVAPRFDAAAAGSEEFQRDADGNVVGGIRTPAVDAPLAALSGFGQSGESFCGLFGVTTPLTDERLADLYGDHDGFVDAWQAATSAALDAGFLLPEDASLMGEAAEVSDVLRNGTG